MPEYSGVTDCVFPQCLAAVTEQLDLPLCDSHCMEVFRAVQMLTDLNAPHVTPPSAEQVARVRLAELTHPHASA